MIYLDNAATTPVRKEVLEEMTPYFSKKYGNASSLYSLGREANKALQEARTRVADVINAMPEEIYFTSGGSEADNTALKGIAFANKDKGNHIIVSSIEHDAVLNTCKFLGENGFEVTYLPVDKYGFVNCEGIERAITKKTILISVMHANNEIGTIEPIANIGSLAQEKGVYFHTDAVQTFGKLPIDVEKMGIDMLSASSHKAYGPKGVGALYVKKGIEIQPLIHGGGHENGLRSGTENVAGIVGFGKAAELAENERAVEAGREIKLRDKLIKGTLKIKNSYLNGHPTIRLPNNANFSFKFIEGEGLILDLDSYGIAASTGSACSSKTLEPSHVLLAIGLKHEEAHGSLRLTIGRETTDKGINYVLKTLPKSVERLRKISPYKNKFVFKGLKGEKHV
jgi:cysteine desulfurase